MKNLLGYQDTEYGEQPPTEHQVFNSCRSTSRGPVVLSQPTVAVYLYSSIRQSQTLIICIRGGLVIKTRISFGRLNKVTVWNCLFSRTLIVKLNFKLPIINRNKDSGYSLTDRQDLLFLFTMKESVHLSPIKSPRESTNRPGHHITQPSERKNRRCSVDPQSKS